MNEHANVSIERPRTKNRIRSVAQAVNQFMNEHGREALFVYKNKADTSFPRNKYFSFKKNEGVDVKCRSKHELLSMPYILSDINSRRGGYKIFVADFFSRNAVKILDSIIQNGSVRGLESKLVFEHVNPCKEIYNDLRSKKDVCNEESLNDFFEERLFVAILTKEENAIVNKTKINGMSLVSHRPDARLFSRYLSANEHNNAGIELFMPNERHRQALISTQFPRL
ncbi:hypothetical protein LH452_15165 [Laribacter hongkongensis]|uniref:hypothetical protein n=1 Tax=Laribacter hongkongensis TaxID=168471 RepID=UPI001EFCC991|nr:hypothetical protein [Laribacter hongkongensis]MCG9060221.1 hypothetical protein [Laribacter hongkongensis]MCG9084401.1 hypothetical protein [Laribacter hongkongensis]MCG9087318.1 hypothetical protein [Laribacter hongkongensis]